MKRAQAPRNGKAQCDRSWEIEAARDGRISGDALSSLSLHREQCRECRGKWEYVEALGRALRDVDAAETDAIAVRRLRQKVLARADAELAGRATLPSPRWWRLAILAAALASIMVVSFIAFRVTRARPVADLLKTTIDAVEEGNAQWARRSEGEFERVELNDGTLQLRVKKAPGGKRVVVRVPDGEIEDIGTVFHVVVNHGHTQRVGVDEGQVTLRLANAVPITLSSGQTWERQEYPAPIATAAALPGVVIPPSSAPTASSGSRVNVPSRRPAAASASMSMPPASAAKEDADYLRVIRLLREGRDVEARAAAKEYLRNFPDGFRREEMGRIGQPSR
jgi:FecR protein